MLQIQLQPQPKTNEMIRKHIYRWHRITSLITAVPVLVWALSGFLHPIMSTIKPRLATQKLSPVAIDSSRIHAGLKASLLLNRIDSFTNVRFVHIDTNWFYQVQTGVLKEPVYLSCQSGKKLPNGNWLYAQYLARQFLNGKTEKKNTANATEVPGDADCCNAAISCVMKDPTGATVSQVKRMTAFDEEYTSINKILPADRVDFNREDHIRIYVETTQDRFVFAMDDRRAWFSQLFRNLHSWAWMDTMGRGKLAAEIGLCMLAFFSGLMGLYIFFTTAAKPARGKPVLKARRTHRFASVIIAVFYLFFTLSGAYHAFAKFNPDNRYSFYDEHWFSVNAIHTEPLQLSAAIKKPVANIGLIHMNGQAIWQVYPATAATVLHKTPAGMDMHRKALLQPVVYLSANNLQLIQAGEALYARYLAARFSGRPQQQGTHTDTITAFAGEYGFANKRLPVYKVAYEGEQPVRYYVETVSGRLAAKINNWDRAEGYSFAFLHKHEFLSGISKEVKDFSTMFWGMGQAVLVATGLILYLRARKKRNLFNHA